MTNASLRARVAELEAQIARLTEERDEARDALIRHGESVLAIEALRARIAQLESAARLARPYIVQATEGTDPPAPALTVLDAALAKESGK